MYFKLMALTTLNKNLLRFRQNKEGKTWRIVLNTQLKYILYLKLLLKKGIKRLMIIVRQDSTRKIYTVICIAIILLIDFGNPRTAKRCCNQRQEQVSLCGLHYLRYCWTLVWEPLWWCTADLRSLYIMFINSCCRVRLTTHHFMYHNVIKFILILQLSYE